MKKIHRTRIVQRKKGDPISADGNTGRDVKLKVKTSPDDWDKLYSLFKEDKAKFADKFYDSILIPVFTHIHADRTSNRNLFTKLIKTQAGVLSNAFHDDVALWQNWTAKLSQIIHDYDLDNFEESHVLLTAYCIQQYYRHRIKEYKLNDFFHPDKDVYETFNSVYIRNGIKKLKTDKNRLLLLAQLYSYSRMEYQNASQNDSLVSDFVLKVNTHYFHLKVLEYFDSIKSMPMSEMRVETLMPHLEQIYSSLIVSGEEPKTVIRIIQDFLQFLG